MLTSATFEFLQDLKTHNHKEWFDENRKRYQSARQNVIALVEHVLADMAGFEPGVRGLEAKQCLFRINRDIRFSKNKAPYKTNFGVSIAKGGRRSPLAGYYFHIEPGGVFAGGGCYMPPSPQLKSIRTHIDRNAPDLRAVLAEQEFKDFYGELQGESLKTSPKGYEQDHPDIDLLRMKSFIATRSFSDQEALSDDFPGQLVDAFATLQPLIAFLNQALEKEG